MSDIIQTSDFQSGEYTIPQDCYSDIQPYLDKYEKKYLVKLLGAELYDLFIADLVSGVPQTARFVNIFNPFNIDDGCRIRTSEGMKAMIIQLVYFYIVRDLAVKKSTVGVGFNVNEVTNGPTYSGFNIIESYNEGVTNYHEISWYICENSSDYPEENGQNINYISGI